MFETSKKEYTKLLKEVKRLCKEFGFSVRMFKYSKAKSRKKNEIL